MFTVVGMYYSETCEKRGDKILHVTWDTFGERIGYQGWSNPDFFHYNLVERGDEVRKPTVDEAAVFERVFGKLG